MTGAYIVIGLGYGDEGKGLIVDALVRKHSAKLVVRFSGGPQCAHNVVTPEGVHHTFAQFGAGTLAGARTHLGPRMLIDPDALFLEAKVLAPKIFLDDPLELLTIDPQCVVILPKHRYLNQSLERARGAFRHGSCGMGVGEARREELMGKALRAKDVHCLQPLLRETDAVLEEEPGVVVFEGNQGVLLDEHHGWEPHRTWTDCTFQNALALLAKVSHSEVEKIGVIRSYYTRHGAGAFLTEEKSLYAPEFHNGDHPWMGPFRVGYFDMNLLKYACSAARPYCIAVTHMDCRPSLLVNESPYWGYALYRNVPDLPGAIEDATGLPVRYVSKGPIAGDVVCSSDLIMRSMNAD